MDEKEKPTGENMKKKRNRKIFFWFIVFAIVYSLFFTVLKFTGNPILENSQTKEKLDIQDLGSIYPVHENIVTTVFWVGEDADKSNDFIDNKQSAWDDAWMEHYGGVDNAYRRKGYMPAEFRPKENPFYFALPYNDFDEGERKSTSQEVYWVNEKEWGENESMCKNRWIRIIKNGIVAYAQWEDAGPFGENDYNYVFGESAPNNNMNSNAGLDVSPAVRDYLKLKDMDIVSWQFVDFSDVPQGPWDVIPTSSQIYWE
ncbi:MAG: hypothetical protein NTU63_03590 [Candidatus Pacearchaeota archaeon]|nr:hypothetical protein [Candidatus Pacearchaeota archaeon]